MRATQLGITLLGATLSALLVFGACGSRHDGAVRSAKDPLIDAGAEELFSEGMEYARLGDFIRAEQYIVASVDRGYDREAALPVLIEVCVKSSRYDSALSHALPHLEREPDNWRLRVVVATLYSALGNGQRARAELQRVIIDQPNEAGPHFTLGKLLWESTPKAAARHLERYVELSPEGEHASEARALLKMASTGNESDETEPGAVEAPPKAQAPTPNTSEEQMTTP
ncbi:MAG: hypothetical protein GY811_15490 [Myxococcales bacterium]|nr:hypothetical protein [Myxococcales bacterium]